MRGRPKILLRLSHTTCGPTCEEARRKRIDQIKPFQFRPGMTGNPTGKNGWSERNDLAAEIARAIFEQDGQAIFDAFRKILRKGSPYAYQVLSDRAYGKLKETHRIEHTPYSDASDEDIEKRIAELKAKLGVTDITHEPQVLPPADKDPKVQ